MSLSQAASAVKQAVAPTFSASSSSLVRQALISQGPQTTASLHSYLHSSSSPLPARPPPRNFLSGARRSALSPFTNPANSTPTKAFPGQAENANGAWSMSFLKKKVLHGMELRGEVLKMTRAKWDKVSARGTAEGEAAAAEAAEGQSARSAKGVKAKEEEHVWVLKDAWQEALARGVSGRELSERAARREQGEIDLRKEYGLNDA